MSSSESWSESPRFTCIGSYFFSFTTSIFFSKGPLLSSPDADVFYGTSEFNSDKSIATFGFVNYFDSGLLIELEASDSEFYAQLGKEDSARPEIPFLSLLNGFSTDSFFFNSSFSKGSAFKETPLFGDLLTT